MEQCAYCGKEMTDLDHNYGTDTVLVCLGCYTLAQEDASEGAIVDFGPFKMNLIPRK